MVAITGKFLTADATPETGRVTFSPLVMAVDDTPDVHFVTRQIVSADLDEDGVFTLDVTPSDDSGWRLSEETMLAGGMPYRVLLALSKDRRMFTVYVPDGAGHDLSDLVDLDAVPEVITVPTPGPENVLSIGDVLTSAPGSDAEVTIEGDSPEQVLNFTLPRGETGPANVLTVGDVTTGAPGSAADVDISGTAPNQVIDFVIPRGDKGETGDPNVLTIGDVTTGAPGTDADADISGSTPNQVLNLTIPRGDTGDTGPVNVLTVGDVTTGAPGSTADVDISGIAPNQVIDFVIPRGDKGETPFVVQAEPPADTDTIWYDLDDEELPFEFGNAAALDVGITTGTVAAGDHAHGAPARQGIAQVATEYNKFAIPGFSQTGQSSLGCIANRQYQSPFAVYRPLSITELAVAVSTAAPTPGALARLGIYRIPNEDNWNWLTDPIDAGTVEIDSLGLKVATLETPVIIQPGLYMTAVAVNDSVTFGAVVGAGGADVSQAQMVSYNWRNQISYAYNAGGNVVVDGGFPADMSTGISATAGTLGAVYPVLIHWELVSA